MPHALLFDLDGTLLNSDVYHEQVFHGLMRDRGIDMDAGFYTRHIHGRLNVDVFAEFLPDEPDPQGLSEWKEAKFREMLPRPYPAMPGAAALIAKAQAAGWRLGVVTNAMRLNAEAMLEAVGLRDAFETLIIGEECVHGKPHPAPYTAAMDALGVTPAQSLAFEDSPTGLASAAAAGARVVGVASALDDAGLRAAGAHATITDFTDTALDAELQRLTGVSA